MTTWPAATVTDLNSRYFDESSRQIGVDEANDFIAGELQNGLRRQLFDNLSTVPGAFSLDALPPSPLLKPGSDPAQLLGLTSTGGLSQNDLLNLLKLEAPLAVQARPPHAGFFPLNKFSVVPLLMKAARTAASDSNGNDSVKEFMVLPDTHVLTLRTVPTAVGSWRVTGIDTSRGPIDLAPGGIVIMALGTIENARLALASFDATGLPTPAAHRQEFDRAPSLEPRHPRAPVGYFRAFAGGERAANRGAVREGAGHAPEWRSDRPLPPSDFGERRRKYRRRRGRALSQGARRRFLRPAADLDRYPCRDCNQGARRDGAR